MVNARPPVSSVMSLKQLRAQPLFYRRSIAVVDADGIDHHVGFLDQRLDFVFGVAAVIVAAIGNDEQRLLGILRLPHLADAHIDGIEQRGAFLAERQRPACSGSRRPNW